ncbi:MAG: hypothetical protein JWM53_3025, partial [bacterium]|nr:hypothetical protein [bacterium]
MREEPMRKPKPPQHMKKKPSAPVAGAPVTPPWAADWITTPSEGDAYDDAGQLDDDEDDGADENASPAANVLAAVAGGALAGLSVYFMQRWAKGKRKANGSRPPAARRQRSAQPGRRAHRTPRAAPPPPPSADWMGDALREAAMHAQRVFQEAEQRARAAAAAEVDDDDAQDRAAAALLGVRVDASADEIGKAFRRLVRQKMQAGAFHDQPC